MTAGKAAPAAVAAWPVEVDAGGALWSVGAEDALPPAAALLVRKQLDAMLVPRCAAIAAQLEERLDAPLASHAVVLGAGDDGDLERWHRILPWPGDCWVLHTVEKVLVQCVLETLGEPDSFAPVVVAHKEACEAIRRHVDETHICAIRRETDSPLRRTLYDVVDPAWPRLSPQALLDLLRGAGRA